MRLQDAPTAIRPTAPEDATAQLALRLANRGHTGPWDPARDESFYTEAGQRLELDLDQRSWVAGSAYAFAVLDTDLDDRLIGRVALSNVVRGPWQNATLGYWIDKDSLGKGHATRAVRLVIEDVTVHKADQIVAHIRFKGGATQTITVALPPPFAPSAEDVQRHQIGRPPRGFSFQGCPDRTAAF